MARFEVLPKTRSLVYLKRAEEFAQQMDRAASGGAWNSVGLLGVHCVISACDSLTVAISGERWSGQDHAGVYGVIRSLNLPGAETALRHIAEVIESKNRVEYEARTYTEREAEELRKSTRRVLNWVKSRQSR
jgi:HEPN domain-containing protein